MILFSKKILPTESQQSSIDTLEILQQELNETVIEMNQIYSVLEQVTEPDLIDCAIYELKSVQMRYTFLYKKISTIQSSSQ